MRAAEVIVGVDASPESRLALRWAADDAARRGRALRIVHGARSRWPDPESSSDNAYRAAGHRAPRIVAAARADVERWAPHLTVVTTTTCGGGAAALIDAAQPGDLVVVGSRGHSTFGALLAGSTCQQVALHAPTSVVIVRGRVGRGTGVVVGFDGSPAAEDVLATAFDLADARGCRLTVLRAYRSSAPAWPTDAPPPDLLNATTAKTALQADLAGIVMPLAGKFPHVPVTIEVAGGDPAEMLVDASAEAQLVVVGSRGHGGFAGLLLGSVGLHLVHHGRCPVVIARAHR